jgi:hypothetical protein
MLLSYLNQDWAYFLFTKQKSNGRHEIPFEFSLTFLEATFYILFGMSNKLENHERQSSTVGSALACDLGGPRFESRKGRKKQIVLLIVFDSRSSKYVNQRIYETWPFDLRSLRARFQEARVQIFLKHKSSSRLKSINLLAMFINEIKLLKAKKNEIRNGFQATI